MGLSFIWALLGVDFLSMKQGREKKKSRRINLRLLPGAAAIIALLVISIFLAWEEPDEEPDRVALWRQDVAARVGALPRSSWQASGALEGTDSLGPPARITVHHSGGGVFSTIEKRSVALAIKRIQQVHMSDKGWDDIGYHYIIDPAGRVWEGRHLDRIGAHAGSRKLNSGNIGLLLLGNFDLQEPLPGQLDSLGTLLDTLQSVFAIADAGVFTHHAIRATENLSATACPGRHISEWLQGRQKKN